MIYTCITCDKTFKQKSGFTDHLNRKNPCIKIPKNIHQITPNYTKLHQPYTKITPNYTNLTPKLHQFTPNYTKSRK